jgi:putative phosphoesterase
MLHPVQIAILSDTHMPRGTRRLPGRCVELLQEADLILHAGDFMAVAVLTQLQAIGEVRGVHGNMDDAQLRAMLPATTIVELPRARIAMIHDAGPARGRLQRLRSAFPDADAVVFGHSHIPMHERGPDGFQIFNPGSPTERRRAPRHTMGVATLEGGELAFRLIELD